MKTKLIPILAAFLSLLLLFSCTPAASADTGAVTGRSDTGTAAVTSQEETKTAAEEMTESATEVIDDGVIRLPTDKSKYKEKTSLVTAATFKSVRQRTDSEVRDVLIYCETEPNATVYVCDKYKTVLRCERAYGPCFYTALPLAEGETMGVSIYAQADGKALSNAVKLTLSHTDSVGVNVFCGKDSKIYLNWYDDHYYGRVASSEDDLAVAEMMIRENVMKARELTGKNTKIIVLIATNPAVIYHDRQYEEPFGRGDSLSETSSTLMAKRLKDDPDIYFIDCRDVLLSHRDEEIFYQTDSHWTNLGAYYCYLEMMNYVHKDFPNAPVADLLKYNIIRDYRISDLMTDNFLNGYGIGMREYTSYIYQTPVSRVINNDSPSIYYVGDSYTGAIREFFYDTFSTCTTNDLYNYKFKNLKKLQPDYLVYVFTERNLDSQCSIVWAQTTVN